MPLITNTTGTTQVDSSIELAYATGVMLENASAVRLEQFVDTKVEVGGKSITFTKYSKLPKATTPLNEYEDIPRVQLADSDVIVTPVEYGTAVTTTRLSSLQTGGKVDQGKVRLIGQSLAETTDALVVEAFMAAPAGRKTTGALSGSTLSGLRLSLAKRSVPKFGGAYVALMNEDQAEILRAESGWVDVAKYDNAMAVLRNEVGMYKGMRVVTHEEIAAGTVIGFGSGAVVKGVSEEARFYIGNPDSAKRFADLGWTGVFKYQLLDTDNVQILIPA